MNNYFEIFNQGEVFDIDRDKVKKEFIESQKKFHPDNFDDLDKQIENLEKIALINEGYRILMDDFLRACHLMRLKNINVLDEESSPKPSQNLLNKIFLLQEEVEEIGDKEDLTEISESVSDQIQKLFDSFKIEYSANNYSKATQILIEIKYLKKIISDLKMKLKKISQN